MPLERFDRLVELAEVEVGRGEIEEDRSAQADGRIGKPQAFGAPQGAAGATHIAAGVHQVARFHHRGTRDRERRSRRLGGCQGQADLAGSGLGRAAPTVQDSEILPGDDLAFGFAGSDEAAGRALVLANRLRLVIGQRRVSQDQRYPRPRVIAATELPKTLARLRQPAVLKPGAVETQQILVQTTPYPMPHMRQSETEWSAPGPPLARRRRPSGHTASAVRAGVPRGWRPIIGRW